MGKKELRDFEIQFVQLPNGEHEYEFELKPAFFSLFPETLVDQGEGKVHLRLLKTETMLTLHFEIEVALTLTCDISLKEYVQPIRVQKRLLVKFGEEESEPDDEVIIIRNDRNNLNIADFIHQYISLEVPMKKVHPDLAEADRPDLVYSTSSEEEEQQTESIDPRWEALKKLKE